MAQAHMKKAKATSAAPSRAWQRMLSGRRLDLIDPSPFDIEIEDIAHGLARVARWNGQTTGEHAFSVAQHCVLVEEIAGRLEPALSARDRLIGLLHDAPEYVIGDMISPFKAALGLDYRAFEQRLEHAIHIRFGLPPKTPAPLKALLKRADLICAHMEAVQLAGFSPAEADTFFETPPQVASFTLVSWAAREAQDRFIARFHALSAAL
jgi:5'-deoxynucleotidase YfbR-like HD superfamily hydrolase